MAESVLRSELEKYWLEKKYFFDFVCIKICNNFVSIHSGLFRKIYLMKREIKNTVKEGLFMENIVLKVL